MHVHLTISHKHKFIIYIILFMFGCIKSSAQTTSFSKNQTADSIEVSNTINNFVDAFTNLEWNKFVDFFADDVTAFFPPSANFPYRANNKIELESIFKKVFDNAQQRRTSAPYIIIEPKDLKIQMLNGVAVVSFILNDPGMIGRRTFILKKENNNWLIVHLHASGIASPNK